MNGHIHSGHGVSQPLHSLTDDLFRSVLDACYDRIYVFDADCRYLFMGQRTLRLLKLGLPDVVGRHWRELGFPAEDMEPFEKEIRKVIATGKPIMNRSRGWNEPAVGATDYVTSPLRDHDGAIVGAVVVARPVVTDDEMDDELRAYASGRRIQVQGPDGSLGDEGALGNWVAQQRLGREATRLHRAIIGSISHDFRVPLTAIIASLAEISEESEQIPLSMIRELSRTGLGQAQRLERFLDNLLVAAQVEAAKLVPHLEDEDPVAILAEALERCERELEGHRVEWQVADDLPDIPVDRTMFIQALSNVLTNAANHTPEASVIRLFVSTESSAVIFRVEDQGPGIPLAFWSDLAGDPYQPSSRSNTARHGLGLEIARAIVAAHGGRVRIGARSEGGASVSLELPFERTVESR